MDAFFALSKSLGLLAAPSNTLMLLALLGVILLALRLRRTGWAALVLGVGGLALFGYSPIANYLLSPLEERFPPFVDDGRPVDGIIQLGGAEVGPVALARGIPALNDSAERMIAFGDLSRRYPNARLVFSGVNGWTPGGAVPVGGSVRAAVAAVGIDPGRVTFEPDSRNTYENARDTKALVQPKPGERWLLVTSAWHMPRAMGTFRVAGFPVTAYPVDYRTISAQALNAPFSRPATGLDFTDGAVKEWVGLLAYHLTGRTDALFPAP